MWKKQLFHATDFLSLMYPNFIICRILGIFPYKINGSTFESSKMRNILQISFLGAFCIYEVIIFYKIPNTIDHNDITRMLSIVYYYIIGGFIAIITYILSGPRMRILQAILKISSRISPEAYRKLSRWIHVKDILGTFCVIILGNIYYFKVSTPLLFQVLGIYIDILIFQMDMLYMNCVCILKICFKSINDNLVHLQNVMINDARYGLRFICDMQENQLLLIELKTLKKQHLIISNTMQMLSIIVSLQLLATVTLTFIEISFEMYFFIFSHLRGWKDWLSFVFYDEFRDVLLLIYIGYLVLKLLLIVLACDTCKNQAFKIGSTIHDVLNCTSNKQIKEELRLFSLQVLHCARNTFTTKGLTVDATLLTAITGSITTYTLILAQFLIITHSCDSKITSNITQIINVKGDT